MQKKKYEKIVVEKILKKSELPEEFKQLEKRNIHYEYISELINYNHFQLMKDNLYVPSEVILAEITDVDHENVEDYLFSGHYRNLVSNHFAKEAVRMKKEHGIPVGISYLNIVGKLQNDTLRNSLLYNRAKNDIFFTEDLDLYFNTFMTVSTNEKQKKEIVRNFEHLKTLLPGNPSPQFVNYENSKGGVASLSDLRGKYVYIDIWATWCGPCIAEIPALKKLERKFQDKNIEFLSISVDNKKDKDKWKKMIKEKKLGGIQLFADNSFNSNFIKSYYIIGIPKFILLDPNGNIVDSNAPAPSQPQLEDLLTSLDL
ncbi:MAG: TlpA disulfide reductase family protein [Candidatus Bathyarchaeota archaeon]|nr:TlpA disulfide reductase family protein [Candidatus Bathyarchaeota archaeon]